MRNNLKTELIRVIRSGGKHFTAYRLAAITKRHINLVTYHLKQMEQQGLVTKEDDGYCLIPILYDVRLIDALYAVLLPYVKATAKQCNNEEQVIAVLQTALAIFVEDLPKTVLHK